MRKLLLLVVSFLALTFTHAQQFPVQVTPQLAPPYSLVMPEYYSPTVPGTEKLRIILLNKDFQKPQITIRLRLTIESQSVRLRTREDVVFPAITQ